MLAAAARNAAVGISGKSNFDACKEELARLKIWGRIKINIRPWWATCALMCECCFVASICYACGRMYTDMCAQHYDKALTEGLSFAPPKLLPSDLETPRGKTLQVRWRKQKEMCDKWYKVLFPKKDDYVRWGDADGSVMSQLVDEMCGLRDISFCEVDALPLLPFCHGSCIISA